MNPELYGDIDELLEAGAPHLILREIQPFDVRPVEELVKLAGGEERRGDPPFLARLRRSTGRACARRAASQGPG